MEYFITIVLGLFIIGFGIKHIYEGISGTNFTISYSRGKHKSRKKVDLLENHSYEVAKFMKILWGSSYILSVIVGFILITSFGLFK